MPTIERFDPYDGELGFALATRVDDIVYVAGMTGVRAEDRSAPEGLEAQLRLAYENINTILGNFETSLDHTIEQVIFFVGNEKEAVEVYDRVCKDVFGKTPPAATMVGVEKLISPRFLIEVKVTAAIAP